MKTKLLPCSPAILTLGLCLFLLTPTQGRIIPEDPTQRMPQDSWYLAKELPIGGEPNFDHPSFVALGPDGNIYVSEIVNERVTVLDPQGNEILSWGSRGAAQGQFHNPLGIHASQDGKVYVVDTHNARVQVFDTKGTFLKTMGQPGDGNGQLNNPHDIAVDSEGNVYVADYGNHRVMVFSPDGAYLRQWGSYGGNDGQFILPVSIKVTPEGLLAVLDKGGCVQLFDRDGSFVSKVIAISADVHGLAIDGSGNFYITDRGSGLHRIKVFSPSGQFLRQFGAYGSGEGELNIPYGVVVGDDRVYVADHGNHRLAVFDVQGNWVANWGSRGSRDEVYDFGLAIDADGNTFVSDRNKNIIKKFSPDMTLIRSFGSPGSGDGQFNGVLEMAIGSNQRLYVVDHSGHRVQYFDLEGNFLGKFGTEGSGNGNFKFPWGIAVGRDDRVYVSDRDNHRVQIFDANGNYLNQFGRQGTFYGQFQSPHALSVAPNGNLAVADAKNLRIQIFDADGQFLREYEWVGKYSFWGHVSPDHPRAAKRLAYSSDGLLFVSGVTGREWSAWPAVAVYAPEGAVIKNWDEIEPSWMGGRHRGQCAMAETKSGDLIGIYSDRVARLWKRTFRTVHAEPVNALPLPTIVSQQRRPGTALVDVDYSVKDADNVTVQTAALAFKNGGNSLADVIPITSFAEGTGSKLGANIATGQTHRFTWDVARDWSTDFGDVQLEILAKDGRDLLNLDFIQIPASSDEAALKISRSPLTDKDFLSVWYWLIATGDPGIRLENGAIEQVGGQPHAAGLWGEYFQNTDFTGTLVDQKIDESFSFSSGSGGFFSIRWTGEFVPEKTGQYTFRYGVDDAVNIWIGGEKVVSDNTPYPTFTVTATANVPLPIRIDYDDRGSGWRTFYLNVIPPGESERAAIGRDFQCIGASRFASGNSTSAYGRAYIFQKMGLREATAAEVTRAKEAGTPGVVNQWDPKLRVGPDERPAKINAYLFDTGADGYWVVPVNGN